MQSIRDIAESGHLDDIRERSAIAVATPPIQKHQTFPVWCVDRCGVCGRLFRRGEYKRCPECKQAVCKKGTCGNLHNAEHRVKRMAQ